MHCAQNELKQENDRTSLVNGSIRSLKISTLLFMNQIIINELHEKNIVMTMSDSSLTKNHDFLFVHKSIDLKLEGWLPLKVRVMLLKDE